MVKLKNCLWGALVLVTSLLTVGCSVNENPVRTSLDVDDTSTLELFVGESETRTAFSKAKDAVITYTSSKPSVASVDQKGKVTGIAVGSAVITISMDETRDSWYAATSISYQVNVNPVPAPVKKNVDKTTPLTLVAAEDGKITVYFNGGITLDNDIKYTVNSGDEQTIPKDTEGSYDIIVKKDDVVQMYSLNKSLANNSVAGARGYTRADESGEKFINIRPSMKTEIFGNVMSLLKGKDNLDSESAETFEAPNAFYGLFSGADQLVNSEERNLVLPATELKEGCYNNMFTGCKGIERAPELPAPTLVKDCYSGMFAGCSKLSEVKCLATDVSADGCVKDWLADAGTEAEKTPVVERAKEANWDVVPDAIPDNFQQTIAVSKITLEPTTLTLMAGETATLKATIEPVDATVKDVKWDSYNPDVAIVSAQGVVTAVSAGSASIVVSTPDGSVSAICQVTVKEKPKDNLVTKISLPETLSVRVGYETDTLAKMIQIFPENAKDKSVTWSSDNSDVVKVDEKGVISTWNWNTGVAHITAKANDGSGVSATCTVTVKDVASIYFRYNELPKTIGSDPFINPLSNYGDGVVTYSSSDTKVATVNASTGEVTIASGATFGQTATITATVSDTDKYIYDEKSISYTVKLMPATTEGELDNFEPGSW